MPRQVRDRLAMTYGFWTLVFAATVGVFGWKFGWLPVELHSPETGTVVGTGGDPMPELPLPTRKETPASTPDSSDAPPWAAQGEPSSDVEFDRRPLSRGPAPFPTAERGDPLPRGGSMVDPAGFEAPMGRSRRPLAESIDAEPPPDAPATNARRASLRDRIPGDSGAFPQADPLEASPMGSSEAGEPTVEIRPNETIIRPARRNRLPADPSASRFDPAIGSSEPDARRVAARDEEIPLPPPSRQRDILLTGGEEPSEDPVAAPSDDPRVAEIDRLLAAGDRLAAHKEMSKIYWKEAELRPVLQGRIDANAKVIYFSPQPHFMDAYMVQPDDQLSMIARHYSVPWQYLAKLNNADPKRIRPGQRLKVIKGPFAAMVDLSDFELIVHAHGYYVKRYRIGIGKDDSTPTGKFSVKEKLVNPTYYGPNGLVIDKDDPANPLGERWIDLGDSYGIHGTIRPDSIGKAESKGCIRLANADVEEVFDLLEKGSEVIIRR